MKKLITLLAVMCYCHYAIAQIPSHKEVFATIVNAGIKFPEVAFAQAILESGHFRSKIAKQNNNLFGMRMPNKRQTTAIGTKYGYAKYKSWQASVEDYKNWQDMIFKKYPSMTLSQFKSYINRIYSTTENYMAKVNTIVNKNKHKYEKVHDDRDSIRNDFGDSLRIVAAN